MMWRPSYKILRKVVFPSLAESMNTTKLFYSSRSGAPRSLGKLTLVSASVGVLIGAGYGGYTHYKVNMKKSSGQIETNEEYAFLKEAPEYKPHYKNLIVMFGFQIINEADNSNLHLILFQYKTCPFCCKVRAFLDARGISYEIVEVDAVLRQAIKWSGYKKVPILLAKVDGGYQRLMDSTAIISILETYLRDKSGQLRDIVKFYPSTHYNNDEGKKVTDVTNKYFIMHNASVPDERERLAEVEEREWRQWADRVLVHTLSPNVYRSTSEALETFRWFEQAGGWRDAFPAWECVLMVYGGAAAMWLIAKRLKTRHNISDARQALYDAANKWMSAVKQKGTPFLGGEQPNLADITVFGVLSSIEGCRAFQDVRNHTDIGRWYDDIKSTIERRRGKVLACHA